MNEVTLTDALKALGIKENQVISSRDAGDRFYIVTHSPTFTKHEILKVQINPDRPTVANITEVTPVEAKPVADVTEGQEVQVKEVGSDPLQQEAKVLPIKKKKKTAIKKTSKKKK